MSRPPSELGVGNEEIPAENESRFVPIERRMTVEGAGQQSPDECVGRLRISVGEEDRELIAADPEGPIGGSGRRLDQPGQRPDEHVAPGMTLLVVGALEFVEVDHRQGEHAAVSAGVVDLPEQLLLEGAVVPEPGERVEHRVEPGPIVQVHEVPAGSLEALDRPDHPAGQTRQDEGQHEGREDEADDGRERIRADTRKYAGQHDEGRRREDRREGHDDPTACRLGPRVGLSKGVEGLGLALHR